MFWTSRMSITTDRVISNKEMKVYFKADQKLTTPS